MWVLAEAKVGTGRGKVGCWQIKRQGKGKEWML